MVFAIWGCHELKIFRLSHCGKGTFFPRIVAFSPFGKSVYCKPPALSLFGGITRRLFLETYPSVGWFRRTPATSLPFVGALRKFSVRAYPSGCLIFAIWSSQFLRLWTFFILKNGKTPSEKTSCSKNRYICHIKY